MEKTQFFGIFENISANPLYFSTYIILLLYKVADFVKGSRRTHTPPLGKNIRSLKKHLINESECAVKCTFAVSILSTPDIMS